VQKLIDAALQLLDGFDRSPAFVESNWSNPFPMGVFGTLRKGVGNDVLMGPQKGIEEEAEVVSNWRRHGSGEYSIHAKAFMPHFNAQGLAIHFAEEASCPFEIYFYEPDEWAKMIGAVDGLEGFHAEYAVGDLDHPYGYFRTLAWLHVLPDDFENGRFSWDRGGGYRGAARDLKLPQSEWQNYPRVPCWVYSSIDENRRSLVVDDSPVIWPQIYQRDKVQPE